MLDDAIRVGFLTLGGLTLALVVIWYVGLLDQEIRGTGQIVIDPLTVVDGSGKTNDELGAAMAQMLQARLQSLVSDLQEAQARSMSPSTTPSGESRTTPDALVGDVRLWTQAVTLQTGLLQPVNMKLSVGGVEVGGFLPWFQRWFSRRRTLHFTVYSQDADAQVFGSLAALGMGETGLRLRVKAAADAKTPSLETIVDALAHEIIHRVLAQDRTNRLEVLDTAEFMTLANVLVSVGKANRNANLGRPAQSEFAALVPAITALADKVPDWPELGYLAARIADSGRDYNMALAYYKRVLPKYETGGQGAVLQQITVRVAEITKASAKTASPDVSAEALPKRLDYSKEIRLVRDSGDEGSVVGQALATMLEFQIEKATGKSQPISARFLYYAARKAGGLDTKFDSGAQIKDGIKVLSTEGAVAEDVWPYRPRKFADKPPPGVEAAPRFRIADARQLAGTVDDLKRALKQNGPVVVGIEVFETAMTPEAAKTGVIPVPAKKDQPYGGHAIVVVGYDDAKQQLKFVNSWGAGWGDKGFGYLPYDYARKYVNDAWTFTFRES